MTEGRRLVELVDPDSGVVLRRVIPAGSGLTALTDLARRLLAEGIKPRHVIWANVRSDGDRLAVFLQIGDELYHLSVEIPLDLGPVEKLLLKFLNRAGGQPPGKWSGN